MTFSVSVLYPKKEGSNFNMDYYLNTHMPLVEKHWNQYGLLSWQIVQFQPGPDGSQPYDVQAILSWKDGQSLKTASDEAGGPVFGDIPNFTDTQPLLVMGDVKKTSS